MAEIKGAATTPTEVAFFADAPDEVIANVIRRMAASGRVVLDIRLMTAPLSVVTR